ncbi:kin of IRRE-like protein 2 [Platysternon megacephalum]|uniref:Suppressor of cytokine signaling 1 n=1 Tax=Platysternon megacephalum TaxID=55544 RepID=A0A4D9DPH3_9SAUR|nr:kin of IRRE-like protein 2 [Platysternon megacephalum]
MVAHSKVAADNAVAADPRCRLDPPARDHSRPRGYHGPARSNAGQAQSDTHFRTFRSQADFSSITRASALLDACGFYWGPLTVSAAHEKLKSEPEGTFLIRDSRQKNCFFAISVKTATGPTSIRINFQAGRFSLDGSKESFDCLFKLLEHYISSPRKVLVTPLRKVRLRPLQELCRKSIVATFGRENLNHIPLNPVLKDYLKSFPFQI